MARHYAEPNMNKLLARNLPFDSDFIQLLHPLMVPLHFFDLNHQYECHVLGFAFIFKSFVYMHSP